MKFVLALIVFASFLCLGLAVAPAIERRARARELGIVIGQMPPGPLNAITDVSGVLVGHRTLIEGDNVRTGVTVVLPHGGNLFQEKVPAGVFAANGFGKMAGFTQIDEIGAIESPIALTNTLSIHAAMEGIIRHTLAQPGNSSAPSINAVAGECNDGQLSEIQGLHVTANHVIDAIRAAKDGPVAEGCVGGGTGTRALGFKAGIGTSSRVVAKRFGAYTVGVLVQANFGGNLTLAGVPVGAELKKRHSAVLDDTDVEAGSCMIVVATDAPLDATSLRRLATRAMLGFGRAGGISTHGSGDYVIAFSTAPSLRIRHGATRTGGVVVANDHLTPLFAAVAEATEEAIINSIFMATDMTGRDGRTVRALPVERTLEILRTWRALK